MAETAQDEVYKDGVLILRTPRTVSDAEIQRRDAPARLRNAYAALRTMSTQAGAIANAGSNPTQAQIKALFGSFGQVCDGLADLLLQMALDS